MSEYDFSGFSGIVKWTIDHMQVGRGFKFHPVQIEAAELGLSKRKRHLALPNQIIVTKGKFKVATMIFKQKSLLIKSPDLKVWLHYSEHKGGIYQYASRTIVKWAKMNEIARQERKPSSSFPNGRHRKLCGDQSRNEPCCDRADEYNGFGSGPLLFICPKNCSCHD